MMFCVLILAMLDIVKEWKKLRNLEWKKNSHYRRWVGNNLIVWEVKPINTYKDECTRWFVRQTIKSGACTAFIQYYESKIADKIFRTMLEKLNVKEILCEVFEAYVKYMSKEKKQ